MFTFFRKWLGRPVVEDFGIDRPFRLRRLSVLLLAGGWAVFLASCLVGLWLVRHHVPIADGHELLAGLAADRYPALQWLRVAAAIAGGATFFAGLFSVSYFDHRDRIPVWRAE